MSFSFGPGVDGGDRAIITSLVQTSRKVLTAAGGGETACTILAYDTLTGLSQAYSRLGATQAARAPDVATRLQRGVAEAGYRNVAIYTGGEFWRNADDVSRVQVVAHEYVHVVQLELEGERLANQTFATSTDQVPPGGPFWLLEGSAEFLSWSIVEDMRLGSLDEKLSEYKQRATANPTRLDEMETYVGYIGAGPNGIASATEGVAALLQDRPPSDLFRLWRLIGEGLPWQSAFAAVFGRPVADFYQTFEASR